MQKSTKDTTLDVGEDRLVLNVNPDKYHLDVDLPFDVNNETCGAQYNKKTKVKDTWVKEHNIVHLPINGWPEIFYFWIQLNDPFQNKATIALGMFSAICLALAD